MSSTETVSPLSPEDIVFRDQTSWLREVYDKASKSEAVCGRVEKGLEVCLQIVAETNAVARYLESEQFAEARERIDGLRGEFVSVGEIICIDGRLNKWLRMPARVLSGFSTPAGILEAKETGSGEILGSQTLSRNIQRRRQEGYVVLELVGPHTSIRHNADRKHPLGCGKFSEELAVGGQRPSDFFDGGLALDLVRSERATTSQLLERTGATVISRVIDTDTQGLLFVGDDVVEALRKASYSGTYHPLTLDVISGLYRSSSLIYTPLLMEERRAWFEQNGFDYGSIRWETPDDLPGNVEQAVALTERIVDSSWNRVVRERLLGMYERRGFSESLIREIMTQIAYNTAGLWLSGYDREENVPARFRQHGERYALIGDKGGDYWVSYSPFLIGGSESAGAVGQHLDVTFRLLPSILRAAHQVDLEREAMVLLVTQPVDPGSSREERTRAEASLAERHYSILQHLERMRFVGDDKGLVGCGRVVVVPMLVHEKTRGIVGSPDFSDHY